MTEAVAAKQQVAKLDKDEEEDEEDDDDDMLPEAQPSNARNEVLTGVEKGRTRENAIHVYGLDFLKTEHMNEIFSQLNHKFVEWINDSSANIMFADAASAKKALESLSFPKPNDEPWRRTPDILVSEDVPPIFLQMRFAMSTDVKKGKKGVPQAAPVQHFPSTKPRRKGEYNAERKRLHADDITKDDALEILGATEKAPKRQKAAPTEEELKRRTKRAERFGEDASATREAEAKASAAQKAPPLEAIEETEEEKARRKKREERFSAPAPAQVKASGTDSAPAAETSADAPKEAQAGATTGESATKNSAAEKKQDVSV